VEGRAPAGETRRGLGVFQVKGREPRGTLPKRHSITKAQEPTERVRIPNREPKPMNCSQVVAHFTDYLDGTASDEVAVAIEDHLTECPTCVRYKNVLEHGSELLRRLPEPALREDFGPRLQHRLFHVDSERLVRANGSSGAPAMTVLAIAVLLTTIAWSPTFFSGAPVVQLEPIVVDRAPNRSAVRPANATPPGTFSSKSEADLAGGLWANTLLYDYTPLSQRYEQRARARRAADFGR